MSSDTRALASLFVALALAISGTAKADRVRSQVAVVRTSSNDRLLREASTRLRAELTGAGFEVIDVERAPSNSGPEPENAPEGALATIAIDRAGSAALADVWISDHVTGKIVSRRLRVGRAPNAASVLAIRALELLRASLLELTLPASRAETDPPPPPDVLKWALPPPEARPLPRRILEGTALVAGAFGLYALGGVGPAVGPEARISHGIGAGWFGRLSFAGPLVGPALNEAGGSATVTQQFLSLDLGWATESGPFGAFAWAGIGAFYLHTTGTARAPYHSTSDGVLSGLASGGLGGMARLGEHLALTGELAALGLVPKPVVVIAGERAGNAGAPSLGVSLGLLAGF